MHLPEADMKTQFPKLPFAIGHDLSDHPLFTLPRLIELARSMDRDRIEYWSGDQQPNQRPEETPGVDLSIEETIRRIEECHAWMVIKNVEHNAEYRGFLKACLSEVAAASKERLEDIQGFIFVSSANSTTPFHVDAEENMLVQIRGRKFVHVFDNTDRDLVPEEAMEISPSKHRNQEYRPEFEAKAQVFEMSEGDGLFLPYLSPHWVRTGERYCISIAVTWKTPSVQRSNRVRFVNGALRKLGWPQPAPGAYPALDAVKSGVYVCARAVVEPLRKSERSRRLIRQILFGRKANYYYEA
jgi:hypothetical protein